MYLLDTNVVSLLEPRRVRSAPPLVDWMRRNGAALFLSAMTVAELEAGILKLRRRNQLSRADELSAFLGGIEDEFGERILPMDRVVARQLAHLEDRIRPRVIELADLIIAATAEVHRLVVLTRNIRHFEPTGLAVLDPLARLPPDAG